MHAMPFQSFATARHLKVKVGRLLCISCAEGSGEECLILWRMAFRFLLVGFLSVGWVVGQDLKAPPRCTGPECAERVRVKERTPRRRVQRQAEAQVDRYGRPKPRLRAERYRFSPPSPRHKALERAEAFTPYAPPPAVRHSLRAERQRLRASRRSGRVTLRAEKRHSRILARPANGKNRHLLHMRISCGGVLSPSFGKPPSSAQKARKVGSSAPDSGSSPFS
jgi:hypothetical protein